MLRRNMQRRRVLTHLCSLGTIFFAGCAGKRAFEVSTDSPTSTLTPSSTQTSTQTPTQTATPTPTPTQTPTPFEDPPPVLTNISALSRDASDTEQDPIEVILVYANLAPAKEYAVAVTVESDAGTTETSKQLTPEEGSDSGSTELSIRPADGTKDGETVTLSVSLLEEDEVVDTATQEFEYQCDNCPKDTT